MQNKITSSVSKRAAAGNYGQEKHYINDGFS